MKQYEYRVERTDFGFTYSKEDRLEVMLKARSKEGWRLKAMSSDDGTLLFVFERKTSE